VTDLEKRSTTAAHRVSALISAVGAREHHSSAERHDQLVALTSHLPYLLAVELRDLLTASDDEASVFVGPAFQGATRVAEANRDLFSEIVALNATNIRAVSERLIADLSRRLDL
jgi:prephenate dehydrogenase